MANSAFQTFLKLTLKSYKIFGGIHYGVIEFINRNINKPSNTSIIQFCQSS